MNPLPGEASSYVQGSQKYTASSVTVVAEETTSRVLGSLVGNRSAVLEWSVLEGEPYCSAI